MKTFTINRLCAVIVLACVSLALYACSSQSDTLTTPTEGSRAAQPNLSNADLLAKAVANMKALNSYHFEEKGGNPGELVLEKPRRQHRG